MTSGAERLTLAQARRDRAGGAGLRRPAARARGRDHAAPAAGRRPGRQVVQIDSVNVLTRSQYLPFFSRLGPYDTGAARPRPRPGAAAPRRVLGARGQPHPADHVAAARLPDAAGAAATPGAGCSAWPATTPSWSQAVLAEVLARGPHHLPRGRACPRARPAPRQRDEWGWNWSLVKAALEHLFWAGQISSAGRTAPVRAPLRRARAGAAASVAAHAASTRRRARATRRPSAS